MNRTFVTTFEWEQDDHRVRAKVYFDQQKNLWKCDVTAWKTDEVVFDLNQCSMSFTVEWMALEYAQRIRKEKLDIPRI